MTQLRYHTVLAEARRSGGEDVEMGADWTSVCPARFPPGVGGCSRSSSNRIILITANVVAFVGAVVYAQ